MLGRSEAVGSPAGHMLHAELWRTMHSREKGSLTTEVRSDIVFLCLCDRFCGGDVTADV
jgi:hypothetical protein